MEISKILQLQNAINSIPSSSSGIGRMEDQGNSSDRLCSFLSLQVPPRPRPLILVTQFFLSAHTLLNNLLFSTNPLLQGMAIWKLILGVFTENRIIQNSVMKLPINHFSTLEKYPSLFRQLEGCHEQEEGDLLADHRVEAGRHQVGHSANPSQISLTQLILKVNQRTKLKFDYFLSDVDFSWIRNRLYFLRRCSDEEYLFFTCS